MEKVVFEVNNEKFELTSAQIDLVYWYKEREYLKEDALVQIEYFIEKHPSRVGKKKYLQEHIEQLVDLFFEYQDENEANTTVWQSSISELLGNEKK